MDLTKEECARIIDSAHQELYKVHDPEIALSVMDLGLIYEIGVKADGQVEILMTFTTPSCPATETIPREIIERVSTIEGVTGVHITPTFEPPWSRSFMSDEAKLLFDMLEPPSGWNTNLNSD